MNIDIETDLALGGKVKLAAGSNVWLSVSTFVIKGFKGFFQIKPTCRAL